MEKETKTNSTSEKKNFFNLMNAHDQTYTFNINFYLKIIELACLAIFHFTDDSVLEITEKRQSKVNFSCIKYLY